MFLEGTWRTIRGNRVDERSFRTPLGNGVYRVQEEHGVGKLSLFVDVRLSDVYVDPGLYSSLGALAFSELPVLGGTDGSFRLTAIPAPWAPVSGRVLSVLARAGFDVDLDGRTLLLKEPREVSKMLRRAAFALFALDPFVRRAVSRDEFVSVRKLALTELADDSPAIEALLHDQGERALRDLLRPPETVRAFSPPPPARVLLASTPPEIETLLGRTVRPTPEGWKKAGEVLSRWAVDPRWLFYLPPEMSSVQTKDATGPLEHPDTALEYYRQETVSKVVVEFKHMGSRAIVLVCKDEDSAERRFGIRELGSIYTRTGRPFFDDPSKVLEAIRDALNRADFWKRFETDWACLDGEMLPWSLKAQGLLDRSHSEVLRSGEALLNAMHSAFPVPTERKQCFERYKSLLEHYDSQRGSDVRFAPFQLIATEGQSHFHRTHLWQTEVLQAIVRRGGAPLSPTPFQLLRLDDASGYEQCLAWWGELSTRGEEGLVIKPLATVSRGRRGIAQPGIKCRTPEHLRLVYGPEYDLPENRWQLATRETLKRRRAKHRRVLKQFALAIESVDRFVRGAPVAGVQEVVRGSLSLGA